MRSSDGNDDNGDGSSHRVGSKRSLLMGLVVLACFLTTLNIRISVGGVKDSISTMLPQGDLEWVRNFHAAAPNQITDKTLREPEKQNPSPQNGADENVPELFMDRLNRLLPDCPSHNISCDSHIRLFPQDVERVERELLQFQIPRKLILKFRDSEYVSIQAWRWMNDIDKGEMCPNCELRHNSEEFQRWNQTSRPGEETHVLINFGCSRGEIKKEHSNQITVGGCGESSAGTGSGYYRSGYKHYDYSSGFYDPSDDKSSPFIQTYAHMHFSPDNRHGFPELRNVTDVVKLLLRPPPPFPRNPDATDDGMFSHNNCGGFRASFVKKILATTSFSIARYGKCLHNRESNLGDKSCRNVPEENFFHRDCEAHRDSTKTVLSSWHRFTFALENTLSPDYFTEKRYQVLYGASVPVVWDNDNSLAFLPDPDAAVVVNYQTTDIASTFDELHAMSDDEYFRKYFVWKERGLRPSFVRRLFMSTDYLQCRICEHMAHHHFQEG